MNNIRGVVAVTSIADELSRCALSDSPHENNKKLHIGIGIGACVVNSYSCCQCF